MENISPLHTVFVQTKLKIPNQTILQFLKDELLTLLGKKPFNNEKALNQHQLVDYAHSKHLKTSHGEVKMYSGDEEEVAAAGRCPNRTRPCTYDDVAP